MKECYHRNYENEDSKSGDIYNDKLDKLKKTFESEMQNKNDHFLKIKPVVTTGDKEKLQRETKEQSNWDSENKYRYYQEGRSLQYDRWQYNNRQQR